MKPQSSSSQALARWSLVMQAPGTRIFHLDFLEDWPMPFLMRCCRRFTAMFFLPPACVVCLQSLGLIFFLAGNWLEQAGFAGFTCFYHPYLRMSCNISLYSKQFWEWCFLGGGILGMTPCLATQWKLASCVSTLRSSGYPKEHHFWRQFQRATPSYLLKFAWRGFLMSLIPLPEHCWAARHKKLPRAFLQQIFIAK